MRLERSGTFTSVAGTSLEGSAHLVDPAAAEQVGALVLSLKQLKRELGVTPPLKGSVVLSGLRRVLDLCSAQLEVF